MRIENTPGKKFIKGLKFASALSKIGVKKGDTVSFLAFNTPEIFSALLSTNDCAVINTINIRLDAKQFLTLDHSEQSTCSR